MAPGAAAPARDRSQQREQLLDLASQHARLLSVLIADFAGDAPAVGTPRDGTNATLPPIETRRPAPVDTDLATPQRDLTPMTTPRLNETAPSPASLWSRRKPPPGAQGTPARPTAPPRPAKSPKPRYSPLEYGPVPSQGPRDVVRRRLRADVAARLRASRASMDIEVVELAGEKSLNSPLVLRPGPMAFSARSALVAPAPADEGPPTPVAVVTPPASVDADTAELPSLRTALVAPAPVANAAVVPVPAVRTKRTDLVAPAPVAVVAPAPVAVVAPAPEHATRPALVAPAPARPVHGHRRSGPGGFCRRWRVRGGGGARPRELDTYLPPRCAAALCSLCVSSLGWIPTLTSLGQCRRVRGGVLRLVHLDGFTDFSHLDVESGTLCPSRSGAALASNQAPASQSTNKGEILLRRKQFGSAEPRLC